MNIDEYLILKNTSISNIIKEIESKIDLADKIVLAVGSLADNIGNLKSDFDILVIDSPATGDQNSKNEIAFRSGNCLVDVDIISYRQVSSMFERLVTWDSESKNSMFDPGFTENEIQLIHRLINGRVLTSDVNLSKLFSLPFGIAARLKFHKAFHLAKTIQIDLVGFQEDGDSYGLLYSAQRYFGLCLDMLLASYFLSNPNPKWRGRLLQQLPEHAKKEIGNMLETSNILAFVEEIFSSRSGQRINNHVSFASEVVNRGRILISYAKCRMENPNATLSNIMSSPILCTKLPSLKMDVFIEKNDEVLTIGRLNEFTSVLTLIHSYRDVIYFFDGKTTSVDVLAKYASFGLDAECLNDLESSLKEHGFLDC